MNPDSPCTVLYVDDEPELLELAKIFLESAGDFIVDTCRSGEESLAILGTRTYDAIISDYQMPGLDGLLLLKAVRERCPDLPFILFTGRGREDVVIQAINLGVDFYIQKGGDPKAQFAELSHKIHMAVERRRTNAALRERDAQLISLSDNLPSGIIYQVISDPEGKMRFVYISAGVETIHEVKAADVLRDPSVLYRQVLPEFRDRIIGDERRAMAELRPFSAEIPIRTPSGRKRWILLRSAPRPLAGGFIAWDGIELDITATKQAEEELRAACSQLAASQEMLREQVGALNASRQQIIESEEKYRTLVEHTDDMVFIAQDGRLVFANNALALLSGYQIGEVMGMPFENLIVPEDRAMVLERHRLRLNGRSLPESYEFSFLHKDQKTRIRVSIRVGSAFFHGRPATTGTIRDLSKERRQEAELARSEEELRKMIAASPDIIVRTDLDGKIVFMNEKGVALSGKTAPEDLKGRSVLSFFAPECLTAAIENTKLMFKGPLGPREYVFITGDNRRLLLEVNGDVLRTPEGTPYGMIYICRDIGGSRQAVNQLRKHGEEVKNIIENMQDVFYRVNRDGILVMISPYGARLMGYDSPDDICGKLAAADFYSNATERDEFLAFIHREKKVTGYPLTLKDRHGSIHYAIASSRILTDEAGNYDGIEGILHDITNLRRIEDALRQANRQITLMTSITRHDIRNQLQVLTAYLAMSAEATADPVRAAGLIAKERQIAATIGQQISFTTEFDGMGMKQPAWQDVILMVNRARAALPFHDIALDNRIPPGTAVFADLLFEKVFYNLFDDALRYGGNGMTAIGVSCRQEGTQLVLVIRDNGIGITAADKEKIFRRGVGRNTGLGLFLVREILSITGMSIRETGVFGKGAQFEITVPEGTYRSGTDATDPAPCS